MYLNPADYVIHIFGGFRKVARAIGRDHSSVIRWTRSRENGGTGGFIPTAAQQLVLHIAKERGLDLTAQDLILGRDISIQHKIAEAMP